MKKTESERQSIKGELDYHLFLNSLGKTANEGAYERWIKKLEKHAELQAWTDREKLLQFELHLTGRAESTYEVLSTELKETYEKSLMERLQPAHREALASAQLLQRKQRERSCGRLYL